MINRRAPWRNKVEPRTLFLEPNVWTVYFPYLLVPTCLSQLRSSAKGHLKIPTAKTTQHISPRRERALQKPLSWTVYGFSIVWARPWIYATYQLAAAFQPGGRPCPRGWGVFTGFVVTFPCFAHSSWKPPRLFLMKILVRRNCISGLMYFCHSFPIMLVVSEGSTVNACICYGLCLGVIMDNKIISNGQDDSP